MRTTQKKRLSISEGEISFYTNLDYKDQSNWWVPLHGEAEDWKYDKGRDCAYEWMKILAKQRTSKKIHWFSAYSIKHHIEDWTTGNPHHCYVSKDMTISAALLVGLPVSINTRRIFGHEIGLYMTELQYEKFRQQANER